MRPQSDIEMSLFKENDKVSSSYYRLPETYPQPVCSGRYHDANCMPFTGLLNNEYCGITTGSENFKLKQKQEYEDNLFKNEDAMYHIDHQILQLVSVLCKLQKEVESVSEYEKI